MNRSLIAGSSISIRTDGAVRLAPLPLRKRVIGIPGEEDAGERGEGLFKGDEVGFESDLRRPTKSGTPLSKDERRPCFGPGAE